MSVLTFECQYTAYDTGDALPVFSFKGQLFEAAFGDGREAGLTIVFGSAPLGGDPPPLLKPQQRGVNGTLVQLENGFA